MSFTPGVTSGHGPRTHAGLGDNENWRPVLPNKLQCDRQTVSRADQHHYRADASWHSLRRPHE